ncbi:unnamed protein product [Calicophoron daubneyi]|uniref:acid phosphatase n=1 Tax=Calicophoron daubneyi TaxID=300641 RepID=A0AAV2SYR0_CALDB
MSYGFSLAAFCLVCFGSATSNVQSDDEIRQLQVVFRHGDRAPTRKLSYLPVPFEKIWPNGEGQLTDKGVDQEFALGRWLRTQYPLFVPESYHASDIYARSTDSDRTISSAQAFLTGLYSCSKLNSCPLERYGISWKPIPVHTFNIKNDPDFVPSNCPRWRKLTYDVENSELVQELMLKHRNLLSLLQRSTNTTITTDKLFHIYDLLTCMRNSNITLPAWCTEDVFEELEKIHYYIRWALPKSSTDILRLNIGSFLKRLADTLRRAARKDGHQNSPTVERVLVYSVHDTQVDYILSAFGYSDGKRVDTAGAVIFELIGPNSSVNEEDFRVKLRYKKGWRDNDGKYVKLTPCNNSSKEAGCRLNLVVDHLKKIWLDESDREKQCQLESTAQIQKFEWKILFSATLLAFYHLFSQ